MLVWADEAVLTIHSVHDLYVARNFTFNAIVGLALHLTLLVKLLSSILNIFDSTSDQLYLLVVVQSLMYKEVSVAGAQAFRLCIATGLELLLAETVIQRLLLFEQVLCLAIDHFYFN